MSLIMCIYYPQLCFWKCAKYCVVCQQNIFVWCDMYGGHSADLLFHIIMSELQYIIADSSPKILSGCEKYLLGAFIYVYSVCLCLLRQTLLDFPSLLRYVCTIPQTTPFKPPSWVWTRMPVPDCQSALQLSWDGMGDVHQGLSLSPPTPSTAMLLRRCQTVSQCGAQ